MNWPPITITGRVREMDKYGQYSDVIKSLQRWAETHAQSLKAAGQRADLPAGSSRAKVTSANAKWARHAEARELAWEVFLGELQKVGWSVTTGHEMPKQPDKYAELNDAGKSFAKFVEGLGYTVEIANNKKSESPHE